MIAFILSVIPVKALLTFLGGAGVLVGFFVKGKITEAKAQNAKVETAEKIVENHAVAQKEAAAKTDGDADAALLADRKSDRN